MAPDKIYVGIRDLGSGYATDVSLSPGYDYPEYIRKDALLEWIQEVRAIPHENTITRDLTFQEVINKLNSM